MKPRIQIATARTPDGSKMELYQHDHDFGIKVNGHELMNSRQHESELELSRLGCAHLTKKQTPRILIGGMGMGYTLRQTLDLSGPQAIIVVGELLKAVVDWNREFLTALNGQALEDKRVEIKTGDILTLISQSKNAYDSILLDVDNGPDAMTDKGNRHLYTREGIQTCRHALREQGCLAIWSAEPSKKFERLLMKCRFHVRRYRVPAYKGSKSLSRFVWVASEKEENLPPGGGKPRVD